jgi:phosphatidylglycerol:prolipoprotein diacylglycerol transferase
MHPILFRVAGHGVESNGVMYFLATIVAWAYTVRASRRKGWNPEDVLPGLILVVLAAYIGARLHGAMIREGRFPADPLGELLRPRGLSFFGGLATGSLAVLGYLRWKRLPLGKATDALAPIAPALYAMFRLGCFLNGDDYGQQTRLPWGLRFPEGSPPTTERVHPTQLYEVLLMVPVFAWLWTRRNARLPDGTLTFELCVLMGAERFVAEFWRLGEPVAAGLSVSQWLALVLVAVGLAGRYFVTARRPKPRT